VEHHLSLGSTNDRAKELAAAGAGELPLLVIADQQTAGRGRGGNRWWTGRGSLAFTLLMDGRMLGDARTSQPLVALAAAVAIVEAVVGLVANLPIDVGQVANLPRDVGQVANLPRDARQIGNLPHAGERHGLGLHWPNDVYAAGRKLAGILVEVLPDRRHVIGIGLNTNNSLADAPPELRQTATTLLELTGQQHDHTAVLTSLLNYLGRVFEQLATDAAAIGRRADELCLQRGQTLSLHVGPQLVTGRCIGIDSDGGLILDAPQGRQTFYAGTVQR
jgi:BirA family biotin operon repressor/biotin-[acetyl-CoA-carboxylase] ligase